MWRRNVHRGSWRGWLPGSASEERRVDEKQFQLREAVHLIVRAQAEGKPR